MMSRTTISRLLFLALAIVVLVHATGSAMWFAGPVVLLALLGLQIRSSNSPETTYAGLAIGEVLVIIIGLSSMPLALIAQAIVLMTAALHLSPASKGAIAGDALVSGIIGITAGTVVFVLDDVYLILFVIFCAILTMLVLVLFNERRKFGISERKHA
jgi:hypothetical protein